MLTSGHHIVQSLVLPGRSTPIVPQGNSVSPYGYEQMKYHDQWTGHIVQCWVPPGRVCSHCAPGELSITRWPWNIITSGHHIVQSRVAPGKSQLSLCPRGARYHQLAMKYRQLTGHCLMLRVPGEVYSHYSVGELNITTWLWNIGEVKGHIALFNVECPWGRVNSHCAPGELVIASWLWNIITSALVIV